MHRLRSLLIRAPRPAAFVLFCLSALGCAHVSAPTARPAASAADAAAGSGLDSYGAIVSALTLGPPLRATIRYADCSLSVEGKTQPGPAAIGGMSLSTYELFERQSVHNPQAFVASSETRLIAHASYGVVYDYVKLRIFEDGHVDVVAKYLDPRTFDVKMDELFTCHLGPRGGVDVRKG